MPIPMPMRPPHHICRPEPLSIRALAVRRACLGMATALCLLAAASGASAQSSFMGGRGGHHKPDAASAATGDAACSAASKGAPPSVIMVQGYVEERLGKLPIELGLNAATATAFERYALLLNRLMNDEVTRSLKPPQPPIDAMHAMNQQILQANDRTAAWEDVQQAAQALMRQLSPEQRAVANKRLVVSIAPKDWMDKPTL